MHYSLIEKMRLPFIEVPFKASLTTQYRSEGPEWLNELGHWI